ncbi:LysR substrate-binding domain-containing protein [Castellaniella hirudinis]|uniref:LysR substrate-binding domain-containing protein n=1 Tax=Castellaniella hirudinis TaxID=1144617 RepID=UPI0039C20DEC
MSKLKRLPPLEALVFFESAARLQSFSAAARELGTTQPAVSHRIGQVERDLGVPLFTRRHRGVSITPPGAELLDAVRQCTRTLEAVTEKIRAHRTRAAFTVASDFCFATYWLMPRLPDLLRQVPGLEIRLLTSEEDFDVLSPLVDFAIAFGPGQWDGCQADLLFAETVLPVCSPAYRDRVGPWPDPAALGRATLLHLDSPGPARWLCWDDWFQACRLAAPAGGGMVFDNSTLTLQAAVAGQGVALGWVPLVEDLLRRGDLVVALDRPVTTDNGYYLVEPLPSQASPRHLGFRRWLQAALAV